MSSIIKNAVVASAMTTLVVGAASAADLTVVSWGGAYTKSRWKPITNHGWQARVTTSSLRITAEALPKLRLRLRSETSPGTLST